MLILRARLTVALLALGLLLRPAPATGAEAETMIADKVDKCPVCGMFVAKYPDFLARITFADGSRLFFDGAKDLFRYHFDIQRFSPGKNKADIAAIQVTDYYSLTPIDARTAWFVVGSDIFGPMGREFIPFHDEAEAAEFLRDHAGKQQLRFEQVTPELVRGLE